MACRYQLRRTTLNQASAPAMDLICLDKEIIKFGRNPDQVNVVLHSNLCPNMISREHAHIRQTRNADGSISYYLFDTSLNGTYVNDIRVNSQILLHPGDVVKFGHVNGAAMAPGQPAPQPLAEFAYAFEKVPRSASTQAPPASVTAQQVHAAAYDVATRRLAAGSPHAWPTNPYAQFAAGPAAAAYLAATGFSHPYLGHIAPGLLTPPPAAAAASTLSNPTTCANQASIPGTGAFPTGPYPGMIGNLSSGALGAHHQQSNPFRPPSSALMSAAAAAEAAAWFNVAAAGQTAQTLPVYQHQQTPNTVSPFAFGSPLAVAPSSSSASNTPVASISQHQQPQLHQYAQQQQQQHDLASQNRTLVGSPLMNRRPAEIDALSSLTLLQKRHEQQQSQPLAYATPGFIQRQQVRQQQYSIPANGGNLMANDAMSIQSAIIRKSSAGADYSNVQSQTDIRPVQNEQPQYQQQGAAQTRVSSSPDCEIVSASPSNSAVSAVRAAMVDNLKSTVVNTNNMPVRESVLVEAQSVVRTFADTSVCVNAMKTAATARLKQHLITTSPTSLLNESSVVAGIVAAAQQLSPAGKSGFNARGDLQKAECDSSVPSPPEDPIRRKFPGTLNPAAAAGNANEEVQIIDHQQSLNHDLLRLAADARSRLSTSISNQDDVFDLETGIGVSRRSDQPQKSSSTSSSSSSLSSDHMETSTQHSARTTKPNEGSEASPPMATPIPKLENQQQVAGNAGLAKKKQRSNEVKRLFDDLQSSYLFSQKKEKQRNRSTDSGSVTDSEESKKAEKKRRKDSSASASSSRSRSQSESSNSDDDTSTQKRKRTARAPLSKRTKSASSFSSASSATDSSDDEYSDAGTSKWQRKKGQNRARARTVGAGKAASITGRKSNGGIDAIKGRQRGRGRGRGSGRLRGRPPGRRSAPVGSMSSDSGMDEKKRRRTYGEPSKRGRGRGRGRRGRPPSTAVDQVSLLPADTWNYHDPSQTCASGLDCVKPDGDNVDWVLCDDCERWFHVNCVGCAVEEVKDEETAFHCGCTN